MTTMRQVFLLTLPIGLLAVAVAILPAAAQPQRAAAEPQRAAAQPQRAAAQPQPAAAQPQRAAAPAQPAAGTPQANAPQANAPQANAPQSGNPPSGNPQGNPAATSPSSRIVEAENAMVTLINNVRVPAQVEGMLTAMGVEEGDLVEAGQTLAVIDDQQAQLTLMLTKAQEKEAELNALNTINRRHAEKSEELAREQAIAYEDLARQGATPIWESRTKALEATRAKLQIELAELNERIAQVQYMAKKSERELAELEVSRRKIVAPFSGFIELRIAQLGEWVQPGSPIIQLVQMDRLRAQGAVSAIDPSSVVVPGMPAVLEFNLGGERTERINGVVGFVGNDVDISNRRRLWVEFENKRLGNDWLIKPGMVPVIRIDNSRLPETNLGQASTAGTLSR